MSGCSVYDVFFDGLNNIAVIVVPDTKLRGTQMLWGLSLAGGRLPVIARHAVMNDHSTGSTLFMSLQLWP